MKSFKQIIKTALPLLIICTVTAILLATVNALTVPTISENERLQKEEAIKFLIPDLTEFKEIDAPDGINALYEVKCSDGKLEYCADVTSKSRYGGDVSMMVAVFHDGNASVKIISHSETYIDRYLDSDGKYSGADAIAGATYSYEAISDGIKAAVAAVDALKDGV